MTITSTIAGVRSSSFDIRHELRKGDKPCVEGFETRFWTIHDPESGRLKSAPIPQEIVERFQTEA